MRTRSNPPKSNRTPSPQFHASEARGNRLEERADRLQEDNGRREDRRLKMEEDRVRAAPIFLTSVGTRACSPVNPLDN